jgi:outer membrane protein OmpA-like peptidoglycan-associated protein
MQRLTMTIGTCLLISGIAAGQEGPRAGAYLGYDYVRFNSATNVPAFSANGGSGQFIYNFNRWLGGVADLGAVHNGNLQGHRLDSTFANFLFGPRVSLTKRSRFKPYLQTLWGGVYATSSTQITGTVAQPFAGINPPLLPGDSITARVGASQTAFAMTVGGGLDIRITKHLTFRPIAVDYYMTRLQNLRTDGDNNQHNLRYSGGLAFWFGGPKTKAVAHRAAPAMKTCPNGSSIPENETCPKLDLSLSLKTTTAELCPGDTTLVTASLAGGGHESLHYSWSINGEQVNGGPSLNFGSNGREPGTYRISATAHGDAFNPATAETTLTIREYKPPTGTAEASPAVVQAGEKSAVSASFNGQCGGPIQNPTFTASEGSMNGNQFDSTGVAFDTSINTEQRKTVTITASAADNRSTGTATTTVEVVKAAVIAPIRLPDVLFTANSSRVNNCGKRILLEQLRSYVERDPGGTVVLVGHSSSDETATSLAQNRAMNAAAVITAGKGICLSIPEDKVDISFPGVEQNGVSFESGFCQSSVGAASTASSERRVEVWFVPTGGKPPASVSNNQNAASLPVSSLGCPK